jgi:predicted ribosome quality control (RQC) complex YloA/Tae2 family protein
VEQPEFERVVTLSFETKTAKPRLVLELFGEGNIILTSEKDEILQALVFKRMRDRNILRGEFYVLPPSSGRNPFEVKNDELENALKNSGNVEVVRALARFLGVGGVYAEEILLRAGVEKTKHCNELTNSEINAIHDSFQGLLSTVSGFKIEPGIVLSEDGSFLDVVPFRLKRFEAFKSQAYTSFNEALDEFYLRLTLAEKTAGAASKVDELNREAERLKRVISEQERALNEAEAKAERDKRIGDAIYAHSSELQALLDAFSNAKREGKEWNIIASEILAAKRSGKSQSLFESFDARNQAVNLCADDLRFSISLQRTLFENAAEFYERGKKAKQKAAGATAALEESRRKLADTERSIQEAEAIKEAKPVEIMAELAKRKVESKEWHEKFRWFISSDGFLVVAGKDATSNEVLVKKHAGRDDVVFHADVTGAPFVIIKTEGKSPSEQALREAGEFAAAFSRAWREGLGSVDVYWVKPDQLSRTGPSGEYVPHGAFAVVGKRNWLRGMPLRVAVGVVEDDGIRFVGAPIDAVKAKTKTYVTVIPGDASGKELLGQILRALTSKLSKEQREKVTNVSIEQIREFVPYTKGRLTEAIPQR